MSVNLLPSFKSTMLHWLDRRRRELPWTERALAALFAPKCLLCGQQAELKGLDLCGYCFDVLPWQAPGSSLQRVAPFAFAPPVDRCIRALKFHGDLVPARVLGALCAAFVATGRLSQHPGDSLPELLLPIPLHRARLRERGFNQSATLARHIGLWLGVPVADGAILRSRATAAQSSLHSAARQRNVLGAFSVAAAAAPLLVGRHVALIDDVYTTGATLVDATRALQAARVARVDGWVVARTDSTLAEPPAVEFSYAS